MIKEEVGKRKKEEGVIQDKLKKEKGGRSNKGGSKKGRRWKE